MHHLHSTMSLLQPHFVKNVFGQDENLHSTMSLLQQWLDIPVVVKVQNLHSTMSLLQLLLRAVLLCSSRIYIPQCLYYNWHLHRCYFYTLFYLHSTMSLLQQNLDLSERFAGCLFTFHNVSITTESEAQKIISVLAFTFHNVSITTRRKRE